MTFYHGTTAEVMRSIRARGLLKGSFVTDEKDTAMYFAQSRADWNGHTPLVLQGMAKCSAFRTDRHGRREAVLLESAAVDKTSTQGLDAIGEMEKELEMTDDEPCEVEWERPKGLCTPHRCSLIKMHPGNHICDCGWRRRLLQRDEPERFDATLNQELV